MEPLTITFGLLLASGVTTSIWWFYNTDSRIEALQQNLLDERVQMMTQLQEITTQLDDLNVGADALLQAHPELSGIISTHAVIKRIERQLSESKQNPDASVLVAEELVGAIRALLGASNVNGNIEVTDNSSSSLGTQRQADRLHTILIELGLLPDELGLNHLELARFGHLCYLCGHADWSRWCYEASAGQAQGYVPALQSLYHIARESGDLEVQKKWLEKWLDTDPDNPMLLRQHALLIVQMDADVEGAERDVRRLKALGVDTPADRSLLSGLIQRSGSMSDALEELELALEEDPERTADWAAKAEILLEMGELDKALKAINQSLELDRQYGDAWALKAEILAKDPSASEEALKSAKHAVALNAGGTPLVLLKAELLSLEGKHEEAFESLCDELNNDPDNSELRSTISTMLLSQGDIEGAEKLLDETPIEVAHDEPIWVARARIQLLHADRNRDGTGETDRVFIEVAKESFEKALKNNRESGIAWLGLARCDRLLGDIGAAEESMVRATRLLPKEPQLNAEAALLALDKGDLSEAGRLVEAASVNSSDTVLIPYIKGNLACRKSNFEGALEYFNEVLTQNPFHVRARLNRVATYLALDEFHKALDDCQELLSQAPEMLLARCRIADILMHLGEWNKAKSEWEEILKTNANHPQALTQLAACETALGRPELAETPLNQALKINPNYAPAWHNRGLLYLDWGKEAAALADFEKAAKADSKHLDALLHIASIHHSASRWEEAHIAWRNVLDCSPENQVARVRLEECDLTLSMAKSN